MSASKLMLDYCRLHPPFQITGLDRCDTLLEGLPPCRIEIVAPVRSLLEQANMIRMNLVMYIRMNLVMYGKRTCQVERRQAELSPTVSVLKERGKARLMRRGVRKEFKGGEAEMISRRLLLGAAAAAALTCGGSATAVAQIEIQWWHAMGGQLGEAL